MPFLQMQGRTPFCHLHHIIYLAVQAGSMTLEYVD